MKKRNLYKFVSVNGVQFLEHRVIAKKIFGKIPKGFVVNHKNGIRSDNRPANLEVVTKSEDVRHAWETGLRSKPEKPMPDKKCPYCKYPWKTRTEKPKRCPKCQRWMPEHKDKKHGT